MGTKFGSRRRNQGRRQPLRHRGLRIEQFEERMLLSVAPAGASDTLINQVASTQQAMLSGKSVAANNNGDFVIVWERNDGGSGTSSDYNIYARYYTNAVQRIDLPANATSFKLEYNGNAVEQLTISGGTAPFDSAYNYQNMISGTYVLSYGGASVTVGFDESMYNTGTYYNYGAAPWTYTWNDPALNLQAALRSLGDELSDVVVRATDAHDFLINFGAASGGASQPLLAASWTQPDGTSSLSGFMPAVEATMVRQPGVTSNAIPISSTDPSITAANIQYALEHDLTQNVDYAPIFFPPDTSVSSVLGSPNLTGPYSAPSTMTMTSPEVTVTPRSATEFDVTFTGDQGLQDQPLLAVLDSASPLLPFTPVRLAGATVQILKQSSDEFRVNDPETQDPTTLARTVSDQTNPQVAMDDTGNFVITWQGADSQDSGSVTDIYARRFSPAGFLSGVTQNIQFTTAANTGTFTLTAEKGTTTPITFDRTNLAKVATDVQSALFTLGYDPTSVTITASSPYLLAIHWDEAASVPQITADLSGLSATPTTATATFAGNQPSFETDMNDDGITGTYLQSVRALGNGQFRVNTAIVNPQTNPSVGMDGAGDFTIAWQSEGQNLGFFNSIEAQRYDYNGNRLGEEFMVNTSDDTSVNMNPYVGMGHDGATVIGWDNTNSANLYIEGNIAVSVLAKAYNLQGAVLMNTFGAGGGHIEGITFDAADNFVIGCSYITSNDNVSNVSGTGYDDVFAQEWQLYGSGGNVSGAVLRPQFRVNSASFDTTVNDFWPMEQMGGQPAMDASGNLTVAYVGYGPDASETDVDQLLRNTLLAQQSNYQTLSFTLSAPPTNGYFRLKVARQYVYSYSQSTNGYTYNTSDIFFDVADPAATANNIEMALWYIGENATVTYQPNGSTYDFNVTFDSTNYYASSSYFYYYSRSLTMLAPTGSGHTALGGTLQASLLSLDSPTLGAVRQSLEDEIGLLRGDANGAMFSQFDTSPNSGMAPTTVLTSDNIANNLRDGQNSTYLIDLDPTATSGTFTLHLINPKGQAVDVAITPAYLPDGSKQVDAVKTVDAIHDQLQALTGELGINWPQPVGGEAKGVFQGSIDVRLVTASELASLAGTPWDPSTQGIDTNKYVYEITFMGEVHDEYVDLSLKSSDLKLAGTAEVQNFTISQSGTPTGGYFDLYFNDTTTTPPTKIPAGGPIYFDPTNLGATAASIGTAIAGVKPGATCHLLSGSGGTYVFQVTFGGASAGVDQPTIQGESYAPTSSGSAPNPLTPLPNANYSSPDVTPGAASAGPAAAPDVVMEYEGFEGTQQYTYDPNASSLNNDTVRSFFTDGASIAMTSNGDFVEVWNQNNLFSDGMSSGGTDFYFRTFKQSTDTAGPQVANWFAPGSSMVAGQSEPNIAENQQVVSGSGLTHIVLSFDKEMYNNAAHTGDAVTNPANYLLLQNGVAVTGDITHVDYGLNIASQLYVTDPTDYSDLKNCLSSNRWEVVLTIDANGVLPGNLSLTDGTYTIEALTPVDATATTSAHSGLRDKAGTALGRTGYTPNGQNSTRNFTLVTAIGEVDGTVYNDLNGNGAYDASESGLAGWTVFADLPATGYPQGNGVLDAGEVSTTTLADGSYKLTGLAAGATYYIREVLQSNWQEVTPAPPANFYSVSISNSIAITGKNFGNQYTDIAPPVVTVTSQVTGDNTPTMTGTVTDAVPSSGISSVTVTLVGPITRTLPSSSVTISGTTWTATVPDATPLPDGTYDVQVTATDNSHHSGHDVTSQELVVDTQPPTVTVDSLPATNNNRPILTGSISDADPSSGISGNVTVVIGSQTLTATVSNVIGYTWMLDMSQPQPDGSYPQALSDGWCYVTASAMDNALNIGTSSITQALLVDTSKPSVTVHSVATSSHTPILTGTVTDPDTVAAPSSGIAGVTVVVGSQTLTATVTGTEATGYTWTLDMSKKQPNGAYPQSLDDGTYDVRATATDNAGNKSDTATNTLTIDTANPFLTVNELVTNDPTPLVAGTVLDGSSSVTLTVFNSSGAQVQSNISATINGTNWSATLASLADGAYTVTATSSNKFTASNQLIVDTQSPTVTVTPLLPINKTTPTLTGTVTDPAPSSGIREVTVVLVGGDGTEYKANVSGGTWSITLPAVLKEGLNSIRVTATDNAGNSSNGSSTTVVATIDTTNPTVTIDPDQVAKSSTPTLTGKVSDPTPSSGISSVTVAVGTQRLWATLSAPNKTVAGVWTWTWTAVVTSPLADMAYHVTATATDNAGNSASDSTTIELVTDTSAPTVTVNSLTTNGLAPLPNLTGTVSDGALGTGVSKMTVVLVAADGVKTTVSNVVVTGNAWSATLPAGLKNGSYDVQATATDLAGNVGMDTTTNELRVTGGTTTAAASSTIGLYDPAASPFYLRNTNDSGNADETFGYGVGGAGWIAITGDWNGDGTDTIGLYDPATSTFFLRNTNDTGVADVTPFNYGVGGAGWLPIAGDWNGDGTDTIGLYNPATSTFFLRNTNDSGVADVTPFNYGVGGAGWLPIAGDWNHDGTDTIGLYNPATSTFFLRNTNDSGVADVTPFNYGVGGAGWLPIAGDWDGDGADTIGLYNPATSTFFLRNTNDSGVADVTPFNYGVGGAGWLPLAGDWSGSGQGLMAAGGSVVASASLPTLSQTDLQPIVHEAIARWASAGLDAATLAKLEQVQVVVADLPGAYLGKAIESRNQVYIDSNAAGYGWFVDPTPDSDQEFVASASSKQMQAIDPKAVDRIDLLTVVEHELGHIAGLNDIDALAQNLMSSTLGVGVRRDP